MELSSRFSILFLLLFCFSIRSLERSPEGATACCDAEPESDEGQPPVGPEFPVEPSSSEEAEQDAQREFQTNRRVSADPFPAIVHRYCKKAALN